MLGSACTSGDEVSIEGDRCGGYANGDEVTDNRMKIAALCGVLEFQLDSVRYELGHNGVLPSVEAQVIHYVNAAEETLAELRTLALARSRE